MNSHDTAIAFLIASDVAERAKEFQAEPSVRSARKEAAQRAVTVPAIPAAKAPLARIALSTKVLPMAGTLSAKEFLQKINRARDRAEQIEAISGYMGYDSKELFGSQELAARTKASRELKPTVYTGPSRQELQQAGREASGFVHGMPNVREKMAQDLQARELRAAEEIARHEKDASDMGRSESARLLSQGLGDVERERLKQIRIDLRDMGF